MSEPSKVNIWEEDCIIPTYPVYPPEKSPMFLEKRTYQGSSGKVYPLPVTEKISDTREEVSYRAVWLENEYLKIMILPELGGRIQRAYDKTNHYDFVYYNHVIKPALVGLTGPWISGGIEFNWPQHHRPSTYAPVEYTLHQNPDGSGTVYVGEIDKMYGTKGMAAITLHPGKAYIEIKGQLFNHTDLPQTFLWWANPAVPVNDHTFSVFPPDVNAVMDHGKRAVSTFPIATGEYYKYDYSAGVDISRYQNVKVPTSFMAAHSDYDFIGNYDEEKEAGLLHVADHHISPGKKQWTWGSGDFGRAWDRSLTDEDGPYIELMTGVFTDNQPDFTWLKPYEEKTFVQYFMPYKGVGRVDNATKDAAASLSDNGDGTLRLSVYVTGRYEGLHISVTEAENLLYKAEVDLSPDNFYETVIPAPANKKNCRVTVTWKEKVLAAFSLYEKTLSPIPSPATALPAPESIKSLEELYLAALHLEQYRHASFEPAAYYLEGLKRDSSDIRLNNGYGLLLFKRGRIEESILYFEKAIEKQTWKNPNPYNGECYFNLALALEATGQEEKAYDAFFKASWSAETQSSAFFWLACLACRKGNYEDGLEYVEKSMIRNWHNMKSRNLRIAILRKLGRDNAQLLEESLALDPLYMGFLYEKAIAENNMPVWQKKMREEAHNYLILSLDYGKAGFYSDAISILGECRAANPLLHYYKGFFYSRAGNSAAAANAFADGEKTCCDYCFPNRIEEISILSLAARTLPEAPAAHYLLGCLYYDKKQYADAVSQWQMCIKEDSSMAMAYRNLSIPCYNKEKNGEKAFDYIKKACELDTSCPRFWLEYDQLASKLNLPVKSRLKVMEDHPVLTASRDVLFLRYITLLNCCGRYAEALDALSNHRFHPWEGGEGKVSTQYRYALIHLAVQSLDDRDAAKALKLLESSLHYPENLGEGKLPNVPDNQTYYYMGLAYKMTGNNEKAEQSFRLAASGSQIPERVLYYNEQPSDYIFYQGLAFRELGDENAARKSFHQMIIFGEKHVFDQIQDDFFAVSQPELEVYQEDMQLRNILYCNYLRALGCIGLGEKTKASTLLHEILEKQAEHLGALSHLPMTE